MFDEIAAGIAAIAAGHGVVVLGGSHNRIAPAGSLRNTAVLAHPDGRLETQDKLHLTPQEHDLGTIGGDDLLVTTVGPFTVGVQICADIQFPELTRVLLAAGVEMVLAPSLTWNRRGVFRVRTGCHARAIENQLFVAMSPLVGSSGLPVNSPGTLSARRSSPVRSTGLSAATTVSWHPPSRRSRTRSSSP